MSETDPDSATRNDPKHQKRDDPSFSPGAGCIIIIMLLSLFTGAAIFGIYSGVRQDRDIVGFTSESPLDLPDDAGTPEELNTIRAKLESFKKLIRSGEEATLELTPRDVNILIHNETAFIEIRDMIYFDSVTPETITGRTSLPLNRLAFWKPRRYLTGKIIMALEASPGKLFLRLKDIESPGKEIQEGFIERIAQDDLLDPYKNDDNEDIFTAIHSASMNEGSVTIVAKPNLPPEKEK
jgi:hypothetical protein